MLNALKYRGDLVTEMFVGAIASYPLLPPVHCLMYEVWVDYFLLYSVGTVFSTHSHSLSSQFPIVP